jgi:hypothetical protein
METQREVLFNRFRLLGQRNTTNNVNQNAA